MSGRSLSRFSTKLEETVLRLLTKIPLSADVDLLLRILRATSLGICLYAIAKALKTELFPPDLNNQQPVDAHWFIPGPNHVTISVFGHADQRLQPFSQRLQQILQLDNVILDEVPAPPQLTIFFWQLSDELNIASMIDAMLEHGLNDDTRLLLVLLGQVEDWRNPVCWSRIRKLLKYSNTCLYYSDVNEDQVAIAENEAGIDRAARYILQLPFLQPM